MHDRFGKSNSEGVLVHNGLNLSICFRKKYVNKKKAGQVGAYQVLIYEGSQEGEFFYGKWYYKGFENEDRFSGTWTMSHD